jgi:hypothetical protein
MYACVRRIGREFFEGVCTPSSATADFRDPPHPSIREYTQGDALWLSGSPGLRRMRDSDFPEHPFHALVMLLCSSRP